MGQSPPGSTYNKHGDGIPLINGPVEFTDGPFGKTVINQYTTSPTNTCEEGDLLLCVRGSTTGRTNIANFKACIGRGVAAIRSLFDDQYIRLFIWRLRNEIIGMGRGIAFPSISKKQIEELPIPLPPLAEQHRIVAKVDELMALCDQLEAEQAKRENRRDRLVRASLSRVNQPPQPSEDTDTGTAAEYKDHVRFHLTHLPRLVTSPEHVKELRQSILNLAVRGMLVEQDEGDEPAEKLLEKILSSKGMVTKPQKRGRRTTVLYNSFSKPFSLPDCWTWVTLNDLITFGPQNGISPRVSSAEDAPKAITLTATTSGVFDGEQFKRVNAKIEKDSEYWLKTGDLLFQRGNTRDYVGMAAIFDGHSNEYLYPDLIIKVKLTERVSLAYSHIAAISPFAREYFSTHASGAQSTMPKINQGILKKMPFPLPPLAEQHRIVAKVDKLMALCDQLEQELAHSQDKSRRLLEAVLREALGNEKPVEPRIEKVAAPAPRQTPEPKPEPTTPVSPKPTPAPPKPPRANGREAILSHMQPDRDYTRADILGALGLTVGNWNSAIRELKEQGEVVQTGQKRGAKYRLA